MKILAVYFAVFAFAVAETPIRELETGLIGAGGMRIPEYRHGYLVGYNGVGPFHGFTTHAPNGVLAVQKYIDTYPSIGDVEIDRDGSIIVGVSNGMLLFDPTGKQIGFIDTGRFVPSHINSAPDHSIWVFGWQRDQFLNGAAASDYMMLRQYSRSGNLEKSFLPRTLFPAGLEPGGSSGDIKLHVTKDRIGMAATSGKSGDSREWLELDFSGNVLKRLHLDPIVRGPLSVAFTEDNHAYVQSAGAGPIFTVDESGKAWKLVANHKGSLMGADGNSLVYRNNNTSIVRLQWYAQP